LKVLPVAIEGADKRFCVGYEPCGLCVVKVV